MARCPPHSFRAEVGIPVIRRTSIRMCGPNAALAGFGGNSGCTRPAARPTPSRITHASTVSHLVVRIIISFAPVSVTFATQVLGIKRVWEFLLVVVGILARPDRWRPSDSESRAPGITHQHQSDR